MKGSKRKGEALITVIMVMTLLTVLGAAILSVSLFQVRQASYEDKRLQAYYLARAGAEAALDIWKKAPNGSKPSGDCNTCFLNSANEFEMGTEANSPLPEGKIGKFDVNITKNGSDTIIASTGMVGDVTQKVTVTISEVITSVPVTPTDWLDGHDLGWYDYKSGQIIVGDHTSHQNKPVKINAKKNKGVKLPNKNSPDVTFRADTIVSFSPVQVIHNTINLVTKVVSFNSEVDFKQNDGKGKLLLKLPEVDGVKVGVDRTGLEELHHPITNEVITVPVGVVYFEGNSDISYKAYYFLDGTELTNVNDVMTKLIPIPVEDPNYINPYSGGTTQEITSYKILWS